MVLVAQQQPLVYQTLPVPVPAARQVLVKVLACGVCRTDLHILDGDLTTPKLPLILGHEIIGMVVSTGENSTKFKKDDLVGIPWLGYTCGICKYCCKGQENLCDKAKFTGYTIDGGYAEYTVAYEQYCFSLPSYYNDSSKAPLLCAGLIGYRSYKLTGATAENIGIYGFGAAAHIIIQLATKQGKKIFVFTKEGDIEAQLFAQKLGAAWVGNSTQDPPVKLDAAIIFATSGELIPKALRDLDKGGVVVCGGIHMSDIPAFPYDILWGERVVRSVANLTRADGEEFLKIAPEVMIKTATQFFELHQANEALESLRNGKIRGAAVLVME